MTDTRSSTAAAAPSTMQTLGVLLTPVWIILATVAYGLCTGEVAL